MEVCLDYEEIKDALINKKKTILNGRFTICLSLYDLSTTMMAMVFKQLKDVVDKTNLIIAKRGVPPYGYATGFYTEEKVLTIDLGYPENIGKDYYI